MNIFEQIDALIDRKMELSMMQNIPDMFTYATEWANLSAAFESLGMLSNADYCKVRAAHYAQFSGEYIRLIDAPFAELVEVPA